MGCRCCCFFDGREGHEGLQWAPLGGPHPSGPLNADAKGSDAGFLLRGGPAMARRALGAPNGAPQSPRKGGGSQGET